MTIVLGGGGGKTWLLCKSSYGATWGPSWIVTWQTKTQAVSPAKQNAHSGPPLKFLVDPLWQIKHFLGQEWETKRPLSTNNYKKEENTWEISHHSWSLFPLHTVRKFGN